jgi:energy-coupling factor transporter ATP-binding protein EcfA2
MSITAITIENFKGIADPVTIPIRPITLLFGKNSAGKSTLLQALHYLREVLEHRRPDPDRTHIGGDAIALGGFQSLVHRNQLDRRIRIRVAFNLGADGIPNNGTAWSGGDLIEEIRELRFDLNNEVKLESAWVETITAWQEGRGAYIAEYATGLNGDELVRLSEFYGMGLKCVVKVNADHAIARAVDNYFMESDHFSFMAKGLPVHERNSIIPEPDKPFVVHEAFRRDKSTSFSVEHSGEEEFWSMVGQVLTGPLAVLLRELRGMRYLGPIRDIPPRTYLAPKTSMESCWASGLGAWDALIRDSDLVEKTSHYLQDEQRLNLGYSIYHREFLSIDAKGEIMAALRRLAAQYEEKDDSDLRAVVLDLERLPRQPEIQLHDEVSDIDVDPSDIGVGVSQVIPVVVGALDTGPSENPCRIFAVEQPELHVHPAVQVALGDMFIDAVNGTERTMLIETHSEHLILRLLRRVRESTDGTILSPASRLTPDMLSIVYVQRKRGGIEITPLPITEEGEFTRHWPDGFFEERMEELF